MPYFSIIIPVYNRPDEVEELLESLAAQSCKDFDIVLVEDGSTIPCDKVANRYNDRLDIHYYYKPNEGRSIARNYGMERADGRYFVFFDSDCIIPPQYFATVKAALDSHYSDCYGGPDAAHDSFSQVQKAINYSMTSFLTTGGIRGGGQKLDKFTPRSFNMGFSRQVYEKVGGYKNMTGEDIDLSMRIRKAGSAGGHNGLKSIIQHLGTDQFPRVKIGVGEKPHPDYDMADWVLGKFTGEDLKTITQAIQRAGKAAECYIQDGPDKAMNKFNG